MCVSCYRYCSTSSRLAKSLDLTLTPDPGYTPRLRCERETLDANGTKQPRRKNEEVSFATTPPHARLSVTAGVRAGGLRGNRTLPVETAAQSITGSSVSGNVSRTAQKLSAPRIKRPKSSRSRATRFGDTDKGSPAAFRPVASRRSRCSSASNESTESSAIARVKNRKHVRREGNREIQKREVIGRTSTISYQHSRSS